jgi:hypothetical protein
MCRCLYVCWVILLQIYAQEWYASLFLAFGWVHRGYSTFQSHQRPCQHLLFVFNIAMWLRWRGISGSFCFTFHFLHGYRCLAFLHVYIFYLILFWELFTIWIVIFVFEFWALCVSRITKLYPMISWKNFPSAASLNDGNRFLLCAEIFGLSQSHSTPQEYYYYYIGYLSERSVAKRDAVFFGKVCQVIT